MEYRQVKRALLSVTDKTGLVDFARELNGMHVELISTGGTARALREAGLTVRDVSDLTGFPEMLDGRVKTLHPKVHGGILHMRSSAEHTAAVAEHGIEPIDMVVVNLYAFEETARKPGVSFGELVENIDIGGPSMVRSAAKNFEDVAVVTSTADYSTLAAEMVANQGALSFETRWRLARQAFALTAGYDSAIATTFNKIAAERQTEPHPNGSAPFPPTLLIAYPKTVDLRYGENPHQGAALYADGTGTGIAGAQQIQGKELSYNNLVDLDAAWELVQEFEQPAVAIIKHSNPAGAAIASSVVEAYQKALATDPVSAFGSVIGVNREVDDGLAEEIAKLFVEAVAAPVVQRGSEGQAKRQEESAPAGGQASRARQGCEANFRRSVAAGRRYGRYCGGRIASRDGAPADTRRNGRASFCLASGQAREVQRRGLCSRRPDHRRGGRPDEPCGCRQIRRHESSAAPSQLRGRFRRIFSLPGRSGGGGCRRRHGSDSAWRLSARSGGN